MTTPAHRHQDRSVPELAAAHRFPQLDPRPTPEERLRRGPQAPEMRAEMARIWVEQVGEAKAWIRAAAYVAAERRAWTPAIADMTGITAIDLWADRLDIDGRHDDAEEVRAFRDRIQALDARDLDGRVRHEPPTNQFTGPLAAVHAFPGRPAGDPA